MNIKHWLRSLEKHTHLSILDQKGVPLAISLQHATITELDKEQITSVDASVYPSKATITYALTIPKLSPKDTLLAIRNYIVEQLGEEITSDSTIVFLDQKQPSATRTVTAVLAQNKPLEEWLEKKQEKGHYSRWYFPKTLCLEVFYETYLPKDRPLFLVDQAEHELTLLYFQEGSLLASRTIPVSSEEETQTNLQQCMTTLRSWENEQKPLLVLTGGDEKWIQLASEFFAYELFLPEERLQPFCQKASCVGAALLAQPSLQKVPPAVASSQKRPFLSSWKKTFLVAALLSLFASMFFVLREKQEERALKASVEEELRLVQKQPWTSSLSTTIPTVVEEYDLVLDDIEKVQASLKKQILFPVQPSLPSLATIISWLNDVISKVSSPRDTLEVQKLTYTLVQYPMIDQMQKRYQLRIDVEFFSPDPQVARHLHEQLLVPNDMILLKNEVKWTGSGTLYKATFFIQDKTRYSQVTQ